MSDSPLTDAPHYTLVDKILASICWKCHGSGVKPAKKSHPTSTCAVCQGHKSILPTPRVKRRPYRPFKTKNWAIPGPIAAFDMLDDKVKPNDDEMISSLCGHWMLYQLEHGHRMTSDDLLGAACVISHFKSNLICPKTYLDLGCGLGSVLTLVNWAFYGLIEQSIGVEAQSIHVELARKTIRINGFGNVCRIMHEDLRKLAFGPHLDKDSGNSVIGSRCIEDDFGNLDLDSSIVHNEKSLSLGSFDLITGTPPYFPSTNGSLPHIPGRGMCAFELRGGIEVYCKTASINLSRIPSARFIVVNTSLEITRTEIAGSKNGLRVIERWDVHGIITKPRLFSVFVLCWDDLIQENDGRDCIVKKIYIRGEDGQFTSEMKDILKMTGKPPPDHEPFSTPKSYKLGEAHCLVGQ